MKRFEDLVQKAKAVGCAKKVIALKNEAEMLLAQERIHVGVIGAQNCGKTTLLNRITGSEIREPDMLSQKERPLRIAFEPMEEDPACDCAQAENEHWRKAQAVLYEIKASDVFEGEDGRVSPLVNRLDAVIYLTSALVPITGEDARVLDALKDQPLTVVISKTDLLEEEAAQKVHGYVSNACAIRGLRAPLALSGMDDWQVTQIILGYIPTMEEIEELRGKHLEMIVRQAGKLIVGAAQQAIEENKKAWKAALLEIQKDDIEHKKIQAEWHGMRADMQTRGLELANMLAEELERDKHDIIEAMMLDGMRKGYNPYWWNAIAKKVLKEKVKRCLEQRTELVQAKLDRDISLMTQQAISMGLIKDMEQAEAIIVEQPIGGMEKRIERKYTPFLKREKVWKDIMSGGLMICGAIVIPWPAEMLAIAMGVSLMVTSLQVAAENVRWQEEEARKALTKYIDENFKVLIRGMKASIVDSYGELVDWMAQKTGSMKAQLDDGAFVARERELEEIIASLM